MATRSEQLLAAIRRLPRAERSELIRRASEELAVDAPDTGSRPGNAPSMLGLFADTPELIDEICALAYQERRRGSGSDG